MLGNLAPGFRPGGKAAVVEDFGLIPAPFQYGATVASSDCADVMTWRIARVVASR